MTLTQLIAANNAHEKLTSLQSYRATLDTVTPVDVPPGVVTYSLTLPADIQTSIVAVVDAAVAAAQAAFNAL